MTLGPPVPLASLASPEGHTKEQLYRLAREKALPGAMQIGVVWYYSPVLHALESLNAQATKRPDQAPKPKRRRVFRDNQSAKPPRTTKLPYRENP